MPDEKTSQLAPRHQPPGSLPAGGRSSSDKEDKPDDKMRPCVAEDDYGDHGPCN